ncbi:MAG: RNA polymerase factor sigma-54 [Candidatus Latescibacteria bacterium]|nr:RNA polymerase factor sigma-54 [Candidatus Latescibacterota bacterium]
MIGLDYTQSQLIQQKLAPQLIQSLHLLQLPTLELAELIRQELEINPLLEIDEDVNQDLEQEEPEDELDEENGNEDRDEEPIEELEFEDPDLNTLNADVFDAQDWDHYLNESGYASPREEFESDTEDWHNDRTSEKTLRDSLLEQVAITDLSPSDRIIAEYLIGNIDEDGFLGCSIGEVADKLGINIGDVECVLGVIQTFDPTGVGARNLQECLLIQLKEKNITNGLVAKVLHYHLDDWINRRFSHISLALDTSLDEMRAVEKVLASLNPKPNIESEPALNLNHVIPDLEVQKIGDEYVVSLTDRMLPELRVSPIYRTLLRQSDKPGRNDQKLRETKKFVVDKLNSARWFINAIHQRRITMLKVMQCIVENQVQFFDRGPGFLKPMVLQEVADKVQMHISTISRVSNGKYVQTPHGVYELKYFFDGGWSRYDDDDISAKSVKEKIAEIIDVEDVQNPLSDEHISTMLKKEGINIARRTVAKYRDQLNISSARLRKAL